MRQSPTTIATTMKMNACGLAAKTTACRLRPLRLAPLTFVAAPLSNQHLALQVHTLVVTSSLLLPMPNNLLLLRSNSILLLRGNGVLLLRSNGVLLLQNNHVLPLQNNHVLPLPNNHVLPLPNNQHLHIV
jgi:hypothetical protein